MDDGFWQSMERPFEQLVHFAPRVAVALAVVLIAVLVGRVFGRLVARVLEQTHLSRTHNVFFKNFSIWLCVLLGVAIALSVLGLDTALAGFLAGSGVAAVVLGFAFREIGENFLAGLFLAFSRPFDVGDYILSEMLEGEVREIELRYTHIRTADGRDIYIPNSQIFNKSLINYTRDGLRRPAFTVGIDYADDAENARGLLLAAIDQIPETLKDPEPTVFVAKLAPQYVELEVSFWINTFEFGESGTSSRIAQEEALRRIRSEVMDACRRALMDNGFTVSSNVTTAVALDTPRELGVRLASHCQG